MAWERWSERSVRRREWSAFTRSHEKNDRLMLGKRSNLFSEACIFTPIERWDDRNVLIPIRATFVYVCDAFLHAWTYIMLYRRWFSCSFVLEASGGHDLQERRWKAWQSRRWRGCTRKRRCLAVLTWSQSHRLGRCNFRSSLNNNNGRLMLLRWCRSTVRKTYERYILFCNEFWMLKFTSGRGDIRTHHPESRGATISTRSTVIVIWYLRPPFLGPSPLNIVQDSLDLFQKCHKLQKKKGEKKEKKRRKKGGKK